MQKSRYRVLFQNVCFLLGVVGALLCLPSASLAAGEEIGHPAYSYYSMTDYGANNQNWVALQDAQGRMLFGNRDCVLEFDGERWRQVPVPGALSVQGLTEDGTRKIWVGGVNVLGWLVENGGDYRFVPLEPKFRHQIEDLGAVWDIKSLGNWVYVNAQRRLLGWDGKQFHEIITPGPTANFKTLSVTGGRVFMHMQGYPLYELLADRVKPVLDTPEVRRSRVNQVIKVGPDNYILCTHRGLLRWKNSEVLTWAGESSALLANRNIHDGLLLDQDRLFLTVQALGGITVDLAGNLKGLFVEDNGLPDSVIHNVARDSAGGIWICGDTSITRLHDEESWSTFDWRNGLSRGAVLDVIRDRGCLYTATQHGVYQLVRDDQRLGSWSFRKVAGTTGEIWCFLRMGEKLLVGGAGGVYQIIDGQAQALAQSDATVLGMATLESSPDHVLLSTVQGLRILKLAGSSARVEPLVPPFDSQVQSMVWEPTTRTFLVTTFDAKVFRLSLHPNQAQTECTTELINLGRENVELRSLLQGTGSWLSFQNEVVCVHQNEGGHAVWHPGAPDQPAQVVERVWPDASVQTGWWLISRDDAQTTRSAVHRHLSYLSSGGKTTLMPQAIPDSLGEIERCYAERLDEKNVVWVAGTYGLIRVEQPEQVRHRNQFWLYPRELTGNDGRTYEPPRSGRAMNLSYAERDLRLRFATDAFKGSEGIQYRTRVDGLERQWSPFRQESTWNMNGVREGRYTLHVQAQDADGVLSNELVIPITIHPPWYRTWWMYVVYLASGMVALVLFVRGRVARLQQQQRRLRALVDQRTQQLQTNEEQLREAKEAAESANRAKSAFLANMSHELRTPLNSILGYAQLLLRRDGQPDDARRKLQTILSSGEHLLEMINEVLDLSKVESGTATLNKQPVAIRRLIGSLVDECQLRANEKGLKFTVSLEGNIPETIETDPTRFRQVVYNLIGNAIKFTSAGEVLLALKMEGNKLRCTVRDQGPGIPEAELNEVFRPFYQASNNCLPSQGVGLGLHICQRMVQLLGGQVGVTSTLGQGSLFWFQIPIEAVQPVTEETNAGRIIAYEGPRRRVLVVDDDEANRGFLQELLAGVGFMVQAVNSGEKALVALEAHPVDVVISDIRMDGKDGITTGREIRTLPGGSKLVLIAVSASVYEDDQHQALMAGFDDFLAKPVKEQAVFRSLRKLLALDWIRDANTFQTDLSSGSLEEAAHAPLSEPVPSQEVLESLLGAAKHGDIMVLRARVDGLSDPSLYRFRQRLQTLVASFRMSEVEQLLQTARRKTPE